MTSPAEFTQSLCDALLSVSWCGPRTVGASFNLRDLGVGEVEFLRGLWKGSPLMFASRVSFLATLQKTCIHILLCYDSSDEKSTLIASETSSVPQIVPRSGQDLWNHVPSVVRWLVEPHQLLGRFPHTDPADGHDTLQENSGSIASAHDSSRDPLVNFVTLCFVEKLNALFVQSTYVRLRLASSGLSVSK